MQKRQNNAVSARQFTGFKPVSTPRPYEKICFGLGIAVALVADVMILRTLPTFEVIFRTLVTELPPITSAVLRYRHLVLALPLGVVGVWFSWPKARNRGLAALLAGALGSALVLALVMSAMYWPIFSLGSNN